MDKRVEAVRNHPKVGRGSCSWIDECLTDAELAERLDGEGIKTKAGAIRWAVDGHDLWVDVMEDVRGHGGCRDGDWL